MYFKEVEVIWANLDPNQHMRHTAYSDYATHARVCFFIENGFTLEDSGALGFGPILLREQSTFLREVGAQEWLRISVELGRSTANYSHFTIVQNFYKKNNKKAARVVIDGAWLDLTTRKLIVPQAPGLIKVLDEMSRTADYKEVSVRDYMFT